MMKVIKKLPIIILSVILIITLIIGLQIAIQTYINPKKIPSIFGWKMFFSLSDDMNPDIKYGDLMFTKDVDINTLKKGDIIAFRTEQGYVMMQKINNIANVKNEPNQIGVQSNNEDVINYISSDQFEGKLINTIPKLGSAGIFLQQTNGLISVVSVLLAIIVATSVAETIVDRKARRKKLKVKGATK